MHAFSEITQIVTALECGRFEGLCPKRRLYGAGLLSAPLEKKRESPSSRSRRSTSCLGSTGPSKMSEGIQDGIVSAGPWSAGAVLSERSENRVCDGPCELAYWSCKHTQSVGLHLGGCKSARDVGGREALRQTPCGQGGVGRAFPLLLR